MSVVKIEAFPWLSGTFGAPRSDRLILEEEIEEGATTGDLLRNLAATYRKFGELAFDEETQNLSGHITIVLNGRLLELAGGLEARLKDGDSVLLLPAFDGGAG
ncbi:MAG: MoaD/ThiS family protein [Chloroflexota bacterium]